jgi:hypothetical protein
MDATDKLPAARSMTWDERLEFQSKDLDPQFWTPEEKRTKTNGQWEREMIMFVMGTMFPDVDFKKMPYAAVASLAHKCLRITAGVDAEEKNS